MEDVTIILASGSPRRRELLSQIGIEPKIMPSAVDETITSPDPEAAVMELSARKAEDAAARADKGTLIIGADTVVAVKGQILGKPKDCHDAERMLGLLQGQSHQVYTGVTLILKEGSGSRGITFAEKTEVFVYPMTQEEIRDYIRSGGTYGQGGSLRDPGKVRGLYPGDPRGLHQCGGPACGKSVAGEKKADGRDGGSIR